VEYTRFGETDMEVSRICFGSWQFGGDWGDLDEDAATAAVRTARRLGIDFFDTAQAYGFGRSERLLGRALREDIDARRGDIVLATKGGLRFEGDRLLRDASRQWLRQGLEESLEYLGTDYVDIYQVHWPDDETPAEETAAVLDDFVREGKVRHVGVSNYDVQQMSEFERHRELDSLQPPYHMFRRDIEEETLPYCREHGIGVLVYSPLAHGLLTGKYDEGHSFAEADWRSGSDVFEGESFRRNLQVVDRLRRLAAELGATVTQLAVAWTLAHPAVDAAIVGSRRPEHIEETAAAAELELRGKDLQAIDEILADAVPVGGPTPEGA